MRWTAEQDQKLREMYEADTPATAIAKILGRTAGSIWNRASQLGLSDRARQQRAVKRIASRESEHRMAYDAGRRHRGKGLAKVPPSGYSPAARAWWLAGWHDKDMELGYRVSGVAA